MSSTIFPTETQTRGDLGSSDVNALYAWIFSGACSWSSFWADARPRLRASRSLIC